MEPNLYTDELRRALSKQGVDLFLSFTAEYRRVISNDEGVEGGVICG